MLFEMKKALNEIDRWLDTAEEQISEDIANYPKWNKESKRIEHQWVGGQY